MKKKITSLVLCGAMAMGAIAQRPSAIINKASDDPVIDGLVDDIWAEAEVENNIDKLKSFFVGCHTADLADGTYQTILKSLREMKRQEGKGEREGQ